MSTPVWRVLGFIVLFTLCIAGRVAADLTEDAYERFYNRYVGTWKANVAKSRYLVGESPKEGNSFTYSAIPGRKGIRYNGDAIHLRRKGVPDLDEGALVNGDQGGARRVHNRHHGEAERARDGAEYVRAVT